MILSLFANRGRLFTAAMGLALAITLGCTAGRLGPEPDVRTVMIILPGNDTVFIDVESGEITSGPMVAGTDINIEVQFFAGNGTPDGRVTEGSYRMDLTSADTNIVKFTRSTAFAGTLYKVNVGVTSLSLSLVQLSDTSLLFARAVPIEIY